MSATELVKNIIQDEETNVVKSWPYPNRRLALLEICRAIDSITVGIEIDDQALAFSREGSNKAISLFMDQSCNEQRTPLFPSDESTFRWAHWALQRCGRIATCEKFLEYERAGLGRMIAQGENLQFEITPKYAGIESLAAEELRWLSSSASEIDNHLYSLLDSVEPKVHSRMRNLVHVSYEHYIGYGGTPEIDTYFDHRGILAAKRMLGHDVFTDDAKFGGLSFGFYRASVWTLAGWALKHIAFALLLHELHPELHLQNLLTVTAEIDTFTSEIAGALQVTIKEALQALDLLELNLENTRRLCINGHTVPPLIRASSEQFLKPVAGSLDEPFQFMLRNLRIRYRTDWDRAVNDRELLFRDELFQLFPQDWLVKIPRSIKLMNGDRLLTDIDAVIVDPKNGIAGLFQLKWQDPFGHSMRERSARMQNFQDGANSWIKTVKDFLINTTDQAVNRVLGCSKSMQRLECRLFIIGRYFAHFSGDTKPDESAAWAVWPQLIRLARATEGSGSPILALHSAVAADSPFDKKVSWSAPSFELGGKIITIQSKNSP